MSDLLTLTNLPREVKLTGSGKCLILLGFFNSLPELTACHGKFIMACKSLILLVLTNLPNLPPIRGYRGAVSNPPHTPYVTIAKESKNYA